MFLGSSREYSIMKAGGYIGFFSSPLGPGCIIPNTCEASYQVVCTYDFVLLSHMRHGTSVNMPYYLLWSLQNMAHYVRRYFYPQTYVTN